jgi:hypothetical protein
MPYHWLTSPDQSRCFVRSMQALGQPMTTAILAPAAVLVLWSLIVLIWMAVRRFSSVASMRANADERARLKTMPQVGGRGQDLEKVLPDAANWPSHNYTHLMEQPTLFYATVVILALVGQGTGLNLTLAWAYTGLRILHSLWQITINTLPIRFGLFILSTVCLFGLAVNGVRATL